MSTISKINSKIINDHPYNVDTLFSLGTPYNGTKSHSVNVDKAAGLGYEFSNIKEWMYELIDRYIEIVW